MHALIIMREVTSTQAQNTFTILTDARTDIATK